MNEQPTNSPFHRGERDLQTRSGVRDQFATEPRILADLTVCFEHEAVVHLSLIKSRWTSAHDT